MFEITDKDHVASSSYLGIGIHENVTMEKPTFDSLTEGKDPVLRLNFVSEAGNHSEVIWNVDPERERDNAIQYPRTHSRNNREKGYIKGEQITPDEAVEIAYSDFRVRMKHVATKFMSEAELQEGLVGATSYELFAEKFIALFTEERLEKGNPLRLKLSPKQDGYATLPRYGLFVESMTVSKEASALSYNNYEKQLIAQLNSNSASDPETFDADDSFSGGVDFAPSTFDEDPGF